MAIRANTCQAIKVEPRPLCTANIHAAASLARLLHLSVLVLRHEPCPRGGNMNPRGFRRKPQLACCDPLCDPLASHLPCCNVLDCDMLHVHSGAASVHALLGPSGLQGPSSEGAGPSPQKSKSEAAAQKARCPTQTTQRALG